MRKKFAWFFCIFMSSLVLLSCSEDNKKGEEPGDGTGGGTPEGDTKTYFETTYSDLSAYVDKDVSEIWAAVGNASKDEENNLSGQTKQQRCCSMRYRRYKRLWGELRSFGAIGVNRL